METDPQLEFVWTSTPNGRNGSGTLTVKLGGKTLYVNTGVLTKDNFRDHVTTKLCDDHPGIKRADVEAKLLALAGDVAGKPNQQQDQVEAEAGNFCIVRPERFIHPQVSGLAVAERTIVNGQPVGRWTLYLRWPDGRRERVELSKHIQISDQSRLWIHPQPSEPLPTTAPGWSFAARRAWLVGGTVVDVADLFHRLCERIAYFLDLPADKAPGVVATLALWVMLTYIYPTFDAVPYLHVTGSLNSGKTRVFEILARLVFRVLGTSNLTAPCLFRTLHNQGGVLLLDEAERLKESTPDAAEIRSILLAGYKRGGRATRLEPVGDTFKPVEFDVYGPKAIACIAGLPPTLASRCIPITMFRCPPGSIKPKRRIDAEPMLWEGLRDDLHVLALEHGQVWLDLAARTDVCPEMSGRHFELWQPLLALATWIESAGATGLTGIVRRHALDIIEAGRDDQLPDADEILLRIVAEKVRCGMIFTPGEVLADAQQAEPVTFKRWTAKAVSHHLQQYGIRAPQKSTHGRRVFNITMAHLRRIEQNYGIDLDLPPLSPPNPAQPAGNTLLSHSLTAGGEGGGSGEE